MCGCGFCRGSDSLLPVSLVQKTTKINESQSGLMVQMTMKVRESLRHWLPQMAMKIRESRPNLQTKRRRRKRNQKEKRSARSDVLMFMAACRERHVFGVARVSRR